VAMFNYAKTKRLVDFNAFDGLGAGRGRGRADEDPPTITQMERLLDACIMLGAYAAQMRTLIMFAAYTGMRPSELYELRWPDIDLTRNRISVGRRLYRGKIDTPKSGPKTIALPPPARELILRQPTRALDLVFVSKMGCRLTASTVCQYWAIVRAGAGLDPSYDFYRCTKHYGVHLLYKLGLSRRGIAAQMGWSERSVEALLRTYGHIDLVALAEVDALYADTTTPEVKA
jgi:integrase